MMDSNASSTRAPAKRVMHRTAADNPYFHRDFHGVLSAGLDYLDVIYGREAVRAYLRRFAHGYHGPLRRALQTEGIAPLRQYLVRIFETEKAEFTLTESPDCLTVTLRADPALAYLREQGYPVAHCFHEITPCLYAALCEDTPWAFERLDYEPQSGAGRLRFFRSADA